MGSVPLHPALVHIPLGLAIAIPLVAFGIVLATWKSGFSKKAWTLVVGLQAVLLLGGIVAQRTGSAEEDKVERVVAEGAIGAHEEAAEGFLVGAGVALLLSGLVLVAPARLARAGTVTAAIATLAVAGLGVRVGKAGGELVYRHGAASAYTTTGGRTVQGGAAAADTEGPGAAAQEGGAKETKDDDDN